MSNNCPLAYVSLSFAYHQIFWNNENTQLKVEITSVFFYKLQLQQKGVKINKISIVYFCSFWILQSVNLSESAFCPMLVFFLLRLLEISVLLIHSSKFFHVNFEWTLIILSSEYVFLITNELLGLLPHSYCHFWRIEYLNKETTWMAFSKLSKKERSS